MEMANIREQCAWIHGPGEATKKADIVECIKERLTDPIFSDGDSDKYEERKG